jgi:hypothetical protein
MKQRRMLARAIPVEGGGILLGPAAVAVTRGPIES